MANLSPVSSDLYINEYSSDASEYISRELSIKRSSSKVENAVIPERWWSNPSRGGDSTHRMNSRCLCHPGICHIHRDFSLTFQAMLGEGISVRSSTSLLVGPLMVADKLTCTFTVTASFSAKRTEKYSNAKPKRIHFIDQCPIFSTWIYDR
jgi:hypothetical protein